MKTLIQAIKTTLGGLDVNFIPFSTEVGGDHYVVLECQSPEDWKLRTTEQEDILTCSRGKVDVVFKEHPNKFNYLIGRLGDAVNLAYLDHRDINRWIPRIVDRDITRGYFNLLVTVRTILRHLKANEESFPFPIKLIEDSTLPMFLGRYSDHPDLILWSFELEGTEIWQFLDDPEPCHTPTSERLAMWCSRNELVVDELIQQLRQEAKARFGVEFHYDLPVALTILAELMDHPKYLSTYGHLPAPCIEGGPNNVTLSMRPSEEHGRILEVEIEGKHFCVSIESGAVLDLPEDILPSDYLKLNVVLVTYIYNYFGDHDAEPYGRVLFCNMIDEKINQLTEI
ncbi:hypothetical protein HWC35_gp016 [Vibrio phage USC-1]|uniref:Uncharacterized protein n=2 Tax=Aphroditevirus USC1 TaxID=2846605 RepID=A0A514A2A1_9CAUD|nr:hypothetical protein HWC35_gp016 [Vibrio phage USC-1]QCW23106.1 hypothetical protein [Vibrio phage 5 TSL-2019]QDH47410.1 hypothetical protein [Vibrio phage USC-1]